MFTRVKISSALINFYYSKKLFLFQHSFNFYLIYFPGCGSCSLDEGFQLGVYFNSVKIVVFSTNQNVDIFSHWQ